MLEDCAMGNRLVCAAVTKTWKPPPVVAILGSTGSGKSKLAIQIARKFNGEIISADSMQLYKGLDIITNKVTPEEQSEAVHHFISCTDPLSRYTVVDFRNRAVPLIEDLLSQNKLPIIVGGTNYYIESLLWEVLIKPEDLKGDKLLYEAEKLCPNSLTAEKGDHHVTQQKPTSERNSDPKGVTPFEVPLYTKNVVPSEHCNSPKSLSNILNYPITQDSLDDISNEDLHKLLCTVDPIMANGLHPNDRRKVIRSLQVYQQHQCCHSDLIAKQKSMDGGSSLGGPLRYKNSLMLWLQCDKSVLDDRLDKRVDQMIENGLITELLNFHSAYNEHRMKQNLEPSYTEGIFQSIGFKEFHEYLLLSEEERESEKGEEICRKAIEDVKLVTRKYARKQVKWVVNRFLKKPDRQLPLVYGLDATDEKLWEQNVFEVASQIVECAIQGTKPNVEPLPIEEELPPCDPVTYYCDICEKRIVGSRIWDIHINSRKHSRRKEKLKKRKLETDDENCKKSDSNEI